MSLTSYRAAPPRVGGGDRIGWIGRPGGDLLSRALRHSTMGAGEFHGRVRDGIGCRLPAMATRSSNPPSGVEGVIEVLGVCCVRPILGPRNGGRSHSEAECDGPIRKGGSGDLGMISMHGVGVIEPIGRLGPVS